MCFVSITATLAQQPAAALKGDPDLARMRSLPGVYMVRFFGVGEVSIPSAVEIHLEGLDREFDKAVPSATRTLRSCGSTPRPPPALICLPLAGDDLARQGMAVCSLGFPDWRYDTETMHPLELLQVNESRGTIGSATSLVHRSTPGSSRYEFNFVAYESAAVPEPSALALLGIPALGVGFRAVARRLRQHRKAEKTQTALTGGECSPELAH